MVMIARQGMRLLVAEEGDLRAVREFQGMGEPARILRDRFYDVSEALRWLEARSGFGVEIADSALEEALA